jgi:(S)-2-hydroxyglutarate dehydrogenase
MSGPRQIYDVVIVGAGIVGLATAYDLSNRFRGIRIVILEKESDVARHQTGHNSGVLHTGLYYKPGSQKAITCTRGRAAMVEFCEAESIAYEICGKVIVATDEQELEHLAELLRRAQQSGIRAESIDARHLKELEPHVVGIAGLHVPDAGIVDYVEVARCLCTKVVRGGAQVLLNTEVLGFSLVGRDVSVETSQARILTRYVINCAGLQSDRLASLAGAEQKVTIVPFRGEYYEFTPEARGLVRNLVYPVPRAEFPFLGVHFTRGIHGEVECGPNAVLNGGREEYGKFSINPTDLAETLTYSGFLKLASTYYRAAWKEFVRSVSKKAFLESVQRLIPEVQGKHLLPAPAGIRAQAVSRDGQLVDDFAFSESEFVLNVINAPSPAATASLMIGAHITDRYAARFSLFS